VVLSTRVLEIKENTNAREVRIWLISTYNLYLYS
jgi:hypothetical protein